MAQNIGLYLVNDLHDNSADNKEYLDLNFAKIHEVAHKSDPSQYPWITSVDEYGHTYVNHYQAKHLIQEIEQLELLPEQQAEAQKIVEVLKALNGEQLVYFAGD